MVSHIRRKWEKRNGEYNCIGYRILHDNPYTYRITIPSIQKVNFLEYILSIYSVTWIADNIHVWIEYPKGCYQSCINYNHYHMDYFGYTHNEQKIKKSRIGIRL